MYVYGPGAASQDHSITGRCGVLPTVTPILASAHVPKLKLRARNVAYYRSQTKAVRFAHFA